MYIFWLKVEVTRFQLSFIHFTFFILYMPGTEYKSVTTKAVSITVTSVDFEEMKEKTLDKREWRRLFAIETVTSESIQYIIPNNIINMNFEIH
jgi:hypothetical protein